MIIGAWCAAIALCGMCAAAYAFSASEGEAGAFAFLACSVLAGVIVEHAPTPIAGVFALVSLVLVLAWIYAGSIDAQIRRSHGGNASAPVSSDLPEAIARYRR